VIALAERAAGAARRDGAAARGWVLEHARRAFASRDRLMLELASLGMAVAPPCGNFLFVPAARATADARARRERGVRVRALEGLAGNAPALRAAGGSALRIGVGPWQAMARVLDVLREVLPCA
jgi:histidinol-phosphate/aromatic aminotransferase/cobyric acid decarboxylase-like protein